MYQEMMQKLKNDPRAQKAIAKAGVRLSKSGLNYLASVIYPEEYCQARVPTAFPTSSATQHFYQ